MMRLAALTLVLLILAAGQVCLANQAISTASQSVAMTAVQQASTTSGTSSTDGMQPAATDETQPPIKKKASTNYGLMLGVFMPTDSDVRDTFGGSWLRYGLRPMPKELPERWRLNFDVSYYYMHRGVNSVSLLPVTVGALRGLGSGKDMRSYLAANIGPYWADISAPDLGVDKTGMGVNVNVTYGIIFKERLSVEARYEMMSEIEGLRFDALTLSAAYKIFTVK